MNPLITRNTVYAFGAPTKSGNVYYKLHYFNSSCCTYHGLLKYISRLIAKTLLLPCLHTNCTATDGFNTNNQANDSTGNSTVAIVTTATSDKGTAL